MASLPTHRYQTAPQRAHPRRLRRRRQAAGPPRRCRAAAALICAAAFLALHLALFSTAAPAPAPNASGPLANSSSAANDTDRVFLNASTAAWNRSIAPPASAAVARAPHRGDALVDLPMAAAAGANPPPITPTATGTATAAPLSNKTTEPDAPTEASGPGPDAASSSSSSDADAPARTSNSDASPYWTVVVPSVTGGAVLITLGIVYLVRRKAEHRGSDVGEPLEWTGLA